MLFICAVTVGGSSFFPCPFIKLEHTQKHDSFCFCQWWMLKWEFWSGFLGLGIVPHEIFCWMSWHSWLPLQDLPTTIFFLFSVQLEFEAAGYRDWWFYSLEERNQFRVHAGAQKRLGEEKCSASLSKCISGIESGNRKSIKHICIFYFNEYFNLLENPYSMESPVRYIVSDLGKNTWMS